MPLWPPTEMCESGHLHDDAGARLIEAAAVAALGTAAWLSNRLEGLDGVHFL
jgi:hypothetical protein